jgi:hypothetical protein
VITLTYNEVGSLTRLPVLTQGPKHHVDATLLWAVHELGVKQKLSEVICDVLS